MLFRDYVCYDVARILDLHSVTHKWKKLSIEQHDCCECDDAWIFYQLISVYLCSVTTTRSKCILPVLAWWIVLLGKIINDKIPIGHILKRVFWIWPFLTKKMVSIFVDSVDQAFHKLSQVFGKVFCPHIFVLGVLDQMLILHDMPCVFVDYCIACWH